MPISWGFSFPPLPQPPGESGGELEDNSAEDVDGDFICEFQELGYSMDESEIYSWLMSDANDPGF